MSGMSEAKVRAWREQFDRNEELLETIGLNAFRQLRQIESGRGRTARKLKRQAEVLTEVRQQGLTDHEIVLSLLRAARAERDQAGISHSVSVREATPGNVEVRRTPYSSPFIRPHYARWMRQGRMRSFEGMIDGEVVAGINLFKEGPPEKEAQQAIGGPKPFLQNLLVRQDARFMGVAKALVLAAEDAVFADPKLPNAMSAAIRLGNVRSQRVFGRLGYELVFEGDSPFVYTARPLTMPPTPGDSPRECLLMVKEL